MVNSDIERIRSGLADLCEPLYDALTWAIAEQGVRFEDLYADPESEWPRTHGWLRTHVIRGLAYHRLRQLSLGRWQLIGDHARNGQVELHDNTYRVRMLHAPSPTDVPTPGTNHARRAYFSNPPLAAIMPLFGPANDRLLGLWRVGERGAPAIRIVRPIGTNGNQRTEVDLSFTLPLTGDDLESLRFEVTDEGIELDLPDSDEGDETGADGIDS